MDTSRSRSTDRRFYGVVEALVVDLVDPDKEDRVKVRFPWFDDSMVSEWCRVAQPYAGNGYGFVFVPEVGDEVLVAFVHGDMRLPIVIGGLYNGKDKPPAARDASNDPKLVRTKGGHELLLDDTSGKEQVRLKSSQGHSVDLDDANSKVTVATSGGQSIELNDSGSKITASTSTGQSIELDGSGSTITISTGTGESITLDGTGSVTVTGSTSVTVEAASIQLGGSAAFHPLVLGELFLTLFNAHVHTAGPVPTSPPVTPMLPAMLSTVTKTA